MKAVLVKGLTPIHHTRDLGKLPHPWSMWRHRQKMVICALSLQMQGMLPPWAWTLYSPGLWLNAFVVFKSHWVHGILLQEPNQTLLTKCGWHLKEEEDWQRSICTGRRGEKERNRDLEGKGKKKNRKGKLQERTRFAESHGLGGLFENCLPEAHVFEHLGPVSAPDWEGYCGTFLQDCVPGRATSRIYWIIPLPTFSFLSLVCGWKCEQASSLTCHMSSITSIPLQP